MNRITWLSFLLLLLAQITLAQKKQVLTGSVKNTQGLAIPNASLYVSGTTVGTSANEQGAFSLDVTNVLPTEGSEMQVIIRSVGYSQAVWKWKPGDTWPKELQITLSEEVLTIQEVSVGLSEDPAYAIIRKAIQKRKSYANETTDYEARVYIKGTQRLLEAPEKFLGVDLTVLTTEFGLDSNRSGILYFSESETQIKKQAPNFYKEEMISSKVSGQNNAFSIHRASDLDLNFYENQQVIVDGLSARPFVSPIADQALQYYRYQYLGYQEHDGILVNKIKLIPRRSYEPLYEGYIYITEEDWRIYGVDVWVTKRAGINFVDSLAIKQDFIPLDRVPGRKNLKDAHWMPSNTYLSFTGSFLSFKFGGNFAAVYSNYQFDPPQLSKKSFREVVKIQADVNDKDEAYWETNRPFELTEEERLDYIKKDSLSRRRNSKAYLDSLDRRNNKFRPTSFLLGGYTYRNRFERSTFSVDGLISSLSYNTVEGMVIQTGATYRKRLDSITNRSWSLSGNIRYGVSNEHLNGFVAAQIPTGQRGSLQVSTGTQVNDLNARGTISPFLNSYYTLIFEKNPLKLYELGFAKASWRSTIWGNVQVQVSANLEDRRWLENTTLYSFGHRNTPTFTPNNPFFAPENGNQGPLFNRHQALILVGELSYDFGTYYETLPTGRRYLPSKYPRLTVRYAQGIPSLFSSDVDFQKLSLHLQKSGIPLGLYGEFSFLLAGGTFLNSEKTSYLDRWSFKGTNTLVSNPSLSSFLLLDPYTNSADKHFAEAHVEYHLMTLLSSKIPFIKRLKLRETIGLHLLKTNNIPFYGELQFGLSRSNVRVLYGLNIGESRLNTYFPSPKHAIRIGIGLF